MALPVLDLIQEISPEYGLQPEWVQAVVEIESNYRKSPRPRYESHIKDWSFGYGQVLSSTAVWLISKNYVSSEIGLELFRTVLRVPSEGLQPLIGVLEDESNNIHLTCAYLSYQMRRYGDIEMAVAAYNAGSARYHDDGSFVNQWHVDKFINVLNRIEAANEANNIAADGSDTANTN